MLNEIDRSIMEKARSVKTGGIDLFWLYWSAPDGATAEEARMDLVGLAPDKYPSPLRPGEFVPIKTLPWVPEIAHGPESDIIIIGGVGCGKTLNMVMVAGYYCCMMPNFRYLGTAPISWQSDLSYREFCSFVLDYDNSLGRPRRIRKWIANVRSRPYPTIEFVNGSTMEFKSLDKDANSIMTWSGDMAVVDQAEDPSIDLPTVVGNLGSRLRGQVGGRARLGKLVIMANSAYNPFLWETYDMYASDPERKAMLLTSYDNPYLTEKQLNDIERRFRDRDEARRLMLSERPLPKGKEFSEDIVQRSMDKGLDDIMETALHNKMPGYSVESTRSAGIVRWIIPPQRNHNYIMAGDPGQANPPYRNSPAIFVFDVTEFPAKPATLAAMDWVFGHGSYWPFINAMNRYAQAYRPIECALDATGTQKAFDDLDVLDREISWTPLNMSNLKMHMVLCLKVLMGRGWILLPKSLSSVWNQLLMWHMPDKALQQDLASTLFMVAYILNQLMPARIEPDGIEKIDFRDTDLDRWAIPRYVTQRTATLRSIL